MVKVRNTSSWRRLQTKWLFRREKATLFFIDERLLYRQEYFRFFTYDFQIFFVTLQPNCEL